MPWRPPCATSPHLDGRPAIGNTVVARTDLGRDERVVLAGHIDTVPLTADPVNLPTRRVASAGGEVLWGRGTVDMKGGVAVMLRVAHEVPEPSRDVTFVFYEAEEIDSKYNGLLHVAAAAARAHRRRRLRRAAGADRRPGRGRLQGHPARRGVDQGHRRRTRRGRGRGTTPSTTPPTVLARLVAYEPVTRVVDELEFREALNAVLIDGGVATNVIPDRCVVTVNYRYAPSLSEEEADAHVRQVFAGFEVDVVDNAGGARPGAAPARGQGVRRGARPAGRGQAGLDRRRPLLGDGRPGRQLRPRRPQPGPHGRRAVPGRAVRRLRGGPAALARPEPAQRSGLAP